MVVWGWGGNVRYKGFPTHRYLNFKSSTHSAEGCYIGCLFNLILALGGKKAQQSLKAHILILTAGDPVRVMLPI